MEKRGKSPSYLGKMIKTVFKINESLYLDNDYDRHKRQFGRLSNRYLDYCTENNVGNTKTRYNPFMAYAFTSYLLLDCNEGCNDGTENSLSEPRKYSQFINKCLHVTDTISNYYKGAVG